MTTKRARHSVSALLAYVSQSTYVSKPRPLEHHSLKLTAVPGLPIESLSASGRVCVGPVCF